METISLDLLGRPAEAVLPVLRHVWGDNLGENDICVERLSGAMTNHVFQCKLQHASSSIQNRGPSTVIVRISGERLEQDSSHNMEAICSIAAAKLGIGPQLLLEFNNGRVEECLLAYRTMTPRDLRHPAMFNGVAKELASFHNGMGPAMMPLMQSTGGRFQPNRQAEIYSTLLRSLKPSMHNGSTVRSHQAGIGPTDIWSRMKQWAIRVQNHVISYSNLNVDATLEKLVERLVQDAPKLLNEVEWLENYLNHLFPSWQVLGHNDLQYGNIMVFKLDEHDPNKHLQQQHAEYNSTQLPICSSSYKEQATAAVVHSQRHKESCCHSRSIRLIDYDYSTWAPAFFDIANHWCEWAADYHSDKPHVMDFTCFPTSDEQRFFLLGYMNAIAPQLGVENNTTTSSLRMDSAVGMPEGVTCNATYGQPPTVAALVHHNGDVPGYVRLLHDLLQQDGVQVAQSVPSIAPQQPVSLDQQVKEDMSADMTAQVDGRQLQACCLLDGSDSSSLHSFTSWCQRYCKNDRLHARYTADRQETTSQVTGNTSFDKHVDYSITGEHAVHGQQVLGRLQRSCLAWTAASHIHWALWGVIHDGKSTINFDYLGYASQRYHQYQVVKSVLLQHAESVVSPSGRTKVEFKGQQLLQRIT